MEEGNNEKVIFNSTGAILERIGKLWEDAHSHSRRGELIKWNWTLDRVWTELVAEANSDEEIDFKKFAAQIGNATKNPIKLYNELMKKEVFLRKVEKRQGKGAKIAEDTTNITR